MPHAGAFVEERRGGGNTVKRWEASSRNLFDPHDCCRFHAGVCACDLIYESEAVVVVWLVDDPIWEQRSPSMQQQRPISGPNHRLHLRFPVQAPHTTSNHMAARCHSVAHDRNVIM